MGGFQAISAANGWLMAVLGACIVFAGLSVLSLVISQLHRVLEFVESGIGSGRSDNTSGPAVPKPAAKTATPVKKEPEIPPAPRFCPTDLGETAELYKLLTDTLGHTFALSDLHKLARKYDYPHPHISLTCLREGGYLVSMGEGQFTLHTGGQTVPATEAAAPPATPPPPVMEPAAISPAPAPVPTQTAPTPAATPEAPAQPAPAAQQPQPATDGTPITAPMPGMIVRFEKKVGDSVDEGETVVVLEAMKMENALPAPVTGTIKSILFDSGDAVAKGDVMCVIG